MPRKLPQSPALIVASLKAKVAALSHDLTGLQQALEGGVKRPVNTDVKAAHRAAHKRGLPARIEADPELKAFILARIDTLTFDDIVAALKASFPPERHVSRSSLHRWWVKIGRFLQPEQAQTGAAQSAIIRRSWLIPQIAGFGQTL